MPSSPVLQLFRDVGARVVLGATGVAVLYSATSAEARRELRTHVVGVGLDAPTASMAALVFWAIACCTIGHAIAPLGRIVQGAGWLRRLGAAQVPGDVWFAYDRLRLTNPHAGELASRLRVGYAMQYTLCATFVLGSVLSVCFAISTREHQHYVATAVLAMLSLLTLWRGGKLVGSFCSNVRSLIRAVDGANSDDATSDQPTRGSGSGTERGTRDRPAQAVDGASQLRPVPARRRPAYDEEQLL